MKIILICFDKPDLGPLILGPNTPKERFCVPHHHRRVPLLPRHQNAEDKVIARQEVSEQDLKNILRKMNLKVTNQRLAILNALRAGRQHITAQEVYEKVQKDDPSIGFATVYRFLRKLTESQLATEVRMGGMPARYELNSQTHHDHLTCNHCGKICEFENDQIEQLQHKVAQHFGFVLTSHVLELYGVCPDCQAAAAEQKNSSGTSF